MDRFEVSIYGREEWDGEWSVIRVTNRAGRSWDSVPKESYLASEEAQMISEVINEGGKLNAADWTEYVPEFDGFGNQVF